MKIHHIPSLHNARKKQLAAYCRVSTDKADQESSFDTQVSYYRRVIEQNPAWELVRIYSDEGKSGTSTAHRPGFMQMIADAMAGKIDIILVKSISRFARNVVDCQTYIQQLRAKGVEVRFEKENINSLNPVSDLIFSMMAAIAQDESRSISENARWAYQKRCALGIAPHIGSHRVLGYDEIDGQLIPNQDAWIIKRAFALFLSGQSFAQIARQLAQEGAKPLRSANPINGQTVRCMLQNEIYAGDRRMPKCPPRHYLTKKIDRSARFQSWYWRDVHPPIIDRDAWDKTQALLKKGK